MNFSGLSKEIKLEIYNKKISTIEQDLLTKVLESGIDPDIFDPQSFIDSFNSIDESVDNYTSLNVLNRNAIFYLSIKNKIADLEKE